MLILWCLCLVAFLFFFVVVGFIFSSFFPFAVLMLFFSPHLLFNCLFFLYNACFIFISSSRVTEHMSALLLFFIILINSFIKHWTFSCFIVK